MNCVLNKNSSIEFQEIDPFLENLLLDSFQTKESKAPFVKKDIFKKISRQNDKLSSDWEKYSEPELLSLLEKCHEIVLSDLDKMRHQRLYPDDMITLNIPSAHREAWLRMIAMARLALASKLEFMGNTEPSKNSTAEEKKLPELLFQQDFLALLLQYLIEAEEASAS